MKFLLLVVTLFFLGFPLLAFAADEAAPANTDSGLKYKDCMAKYSDEEMCSEVAILGGERTIASDTSEKLSEVSVKAPAESKE